MLPRFITVIKKPTPTHSQQNTRKIPIPLYYESSRLMPDRISNTRNLITMIMLTLTEIVVNIFLQLFQINPNLINAFLQLEILYR